MEGLVHKINVKTEIAGERGIPKLPVELARFTERGVEGDYNHFRSFWKLGTSSRAVLIIPLEVLADLNNEGWPVKPGDLGENITSRGVSYNFFQIGCICTW